MLLDHLVSLFLSAGIAAGAVVAAELLARAPALGPRRRVLLLLAAVRRLAQLELLRGRLRRAVPTALLLARGRRLRRKHFLDVLRVDHVGRAPLALEALLPALRRRLATLLAYSEATLRISVELTAAADRKLAPKADRPRLMRIRVSGMPLVGGVQMLLVMVSWVNLAAASLFIIASFRLYLT